MMFKRDNRELQSTLRRANKRLKQNSKTVQDLHVENLQVELPRKIWTMESLVKLTITKCNLVTIPKQLEKLSRTLAYLDLSCNDIKIVPRTFCCKMSQLETLKIGTNKIQTLPIEIKFMENLTSLDLSDNQLRMLPSTFSDLRNLRILIVANNNLSQLPAFKRNEIRLKMLDISFNPLDGASLGRSTFEVHSSFDEPFGYDENLFTPTTPILNRFPKLFQIALLRIVSCDKMLKLAAEEMLPPSIISTMQRDTFKCYRCGKMGILPAYNCTDTLDYVDQVESLQFSSNFTQRMTFMKLFCRKCFIPIHQLGA